VNLRRTTITLGLMALPLGISAICGCDKDDTVQTYKLAKTSDTPVANDTPAPTPTPADNASEPIHWTVPAGWKQLPGNDMRYASFEVAADHPDLLLTVVPLGKDPGSLLSNVNRWEGQIHLPPSSQDDLKDLISPITVAGAPALIFDRTGPAPADHTQPQRILAAILAHGDRTWFLKLAGPNNLVQAQKPTFDTFVQSIWFETPSAPVTDVVPVPPAPAAPADSALPITFVVPPGWQQETGAKTNPFRVVTFNVTSGAETAEAVVTHTVKDSGSMLDNINNWRSQVGLDPVDDAAKAPSEKVMVHGEEATVWNFENPATGRQLTLAMIAHGNDWWFFKLGGTATLVISQKSNFNSFVTSIQFRG